MGDNYFDQNVFPGQQIYSNNNIPNPLNNQERNIQFNNNNVFHTFMENIIRQNQGKKVVIYMSFPDAKDREFKGIIEQSGKDYIILSDPSDGKWFLLPMNHINFIVFDEKINSTNF